MVSVAAQIPVTNDRVEVNGYDALGVIVTLDSFESARFVFMLSYAPYTREEAEEEFAESLKDYNVKYDKSKMVAYTSPSGDREVVVDADVDAEYWWGVPVSGSWTSVLKLISGYNGDPGVVDQADPFHLDNDWTYLKDEDGVWQAPVHPECLENVESYLEARKETRVHATS